MEPDTDLSAELQRTVRSDLRRHMELASAARWRSLAEGRLDTGRLEELDFLLSRYVPPSSSVIWIESGLQPARSQRTLLPFPPSPPRSWQLFAAGPEGSQSAPWIAPGYAYEFRLRTEAHNETVAAVTVVAELPTGARPSAPADRKADVNGRDRPHLDAVPNPARVQGTHASTTLAWSTGDGSRGKVEVAGYRIDEDILEDDADAIAALNGLRDAGGGFVLAPAGCLWWLDLYPEFGRYLERFPILVEEPSVGRLYDLRDARRQRRRS
jgi:hypothetical protein